MSTTTYVIFHETLIYFSFLSEIQGENYDEIYIFIPQEVNIEFRLGKGSNKVVLGDDATI